MNENKATVKLHYFKLVFKSNKENDGLSSSDILKACIKAINDKMITEQKAIVIDRYKGRKDSESRNLFIRTISFNSKDKKYKGRIALIRENKLPILVDKNNFSFTPLKDLGKNVIAAETTNFYIDINKSTPVFCCEFNSLGPRILDIEFYFRHIASHHMLSISKSCQAHIHMIKSVNEVIDSISDVLKFSIRARKKRLNFLTSNVNESFMANMNNLANTVNPNSIRVEASFRERGSDKKGPKNIGGIRFAKNLLKAINKKEDLIDDIDDFYLEFENTDGEVAEFSLLRGRFESEVICSYKTPGNLDKKELYEKAMHEFELYLKNHN